MDKGDTLSIEGLIDTYSDRDNEERLLSYGVTINRKPVGETLSDWLLDRGYLHMPDNADVHVRITIEVTDVTRRTEPERTSYLLRNTGRTAQ